VFAAQLFGHLRAQTAGLPGKLESGNAGFL